jgi:hypothetical protein
VRTGTSVRVVDFVGQTHSLDKFDAAAERSLLSNYLGKVGTVVQVDGMDMPFRVAFSTSQGVPMDEMRFYPDELGEV